MITDVSYLYEENNMWPMYWCLWSQISFIASLVNIFYVDTKAGASLSPLQIHSKCQTSRAGGGKTNIFCKSLPDDKEEGFLTYCFPCGSFSCNFSSTLTSSLAASLYLSTFLMIFNARTWSLKKRNYQGIVWKISGVVFLHRVVSDLVTLTRMAIWKRNIFV